MNFLKKIFTIFALTLVLCFSFNCKPQKNIADAGNPKSGTLANVNQASTKIDSLKIATNSSNSIKATNGKVPTQTIIGNQPKQNPNSMQKPRPH